MKGRTEKALESEKKMLNKLQYYPQALTEFYYDMKDNGKSYMTSEVYMNYVINFTLFFTNKTIKENFYKSVTSSDIKRYMNAIKIREDKNGNIIEIGDEIRAAHWSALNLFFDFLLENNYINENPVSKTKRPRAKTEHEVTYLEPEEIQAMLKKVKNEAKDCFKARDLCLLSLMIATGLRVSAVCNINISDINFKENTISVIEKGHKTRKIPFGDNLKSVIENCIKARRYYFRGTNTDALFVSQFRKRISTDSVARVVKTYTEGITDKKITPHKLRATCAVTIYDNTKDILVVKEILGHENIETTQIYTRASEEGKKKAIQIMDNMV